MDRVSAYNQARGGLGVVAVNGAVYAIGGSTSEYPSSASLSSGGFLGTNEEYNITTGAWTNKAPMPVARGYFAIAAYQGKIYCIGGQSGWEVEPAADYLWGPTMSSVNEVYDVATDSWKTLSPMPTGDMYLGAEAVDGLILVKAIGFGWAYNITADSWSNTTALPLYSWYQNGNPTTFVQMNINNQTLKTDVKDGAAAETSGINAPISAYVMGSRVNEVYNLANDSWTKAAAMPTPRSDFGLAVSNDILYAIGGFGPTNVNEQYTPIGYGTPDPAYAIEHTSPKISLLAPLNQTYRDSSILVLFTIDKKAAWTGYSIDRGQNVTISSNSTLTDLANGLHSITVYGNDTDGNMGSSETIDFTVTMQVPFPNSTVAIISGVAIVCVTAAGLLVYFKTRIKSKKALILT